MHGAQQLLVAHQPSVVHEPPHGLEREPRRHPADQAVGHRVDPALDHAPGVEALDHGRRALGLHRDHLRRGLERLERGGRARDQGAPAEGHDHGIDGIERLGRFERHGAGAFHHVEALAVIDEEKLALGGEGLGPVLGLVDVGAAPVHATAEGLDHRYLQGVGDLGQEDVGRDAEEPGGVGDALAVVAARRRHGTARVAAGAGPNQRVERPSELERGDRRDGLVLDPDLGAEGARQHLGAHHWRDREMGAQRLGRGADAGKGGERRRRMLLGRARQLASSIAARRLAWSSAIRASMTSSRASPAITFSSL